MTPQEKHALEGQVGKLNAMIDWIRINVMPTTGPMITHAVINDLNKISTSLQTLLLDVSPSVTLEHLTPAYLEALWRKKGITAARIRDCGICEAPLYYRFEMEILVFDSSCDCNTIDGRRNVTWVKLVQRIKEEKSFAEQRDTAKIFGVDLVLVMPVISSVEAIEIIMPDDDDE